LACNPVIESDRIFFSRCNFLGVFVSVVQQQDYPDLFLDFLTTVSSIKLIFDKRVVMSLQYQQGDNSEECNYRVAIHLNNVGVALLERRAYKQALDTLKDAVTVVRQAFVDEDDENQSSMLTKAARRLATPKSLVLASSGLVTISEDAGFETIRPLTHAGGSDQALCAVKMEHFGQEDRDIDIDSATVLHNFSVAHLLLACVAKTNSCAKQLRVGALKLASLSYRTLSTLLVVRDENELENMIMLKPNLFLIAISVLRCLVHALHESNQVIKAQQSYQRLLLLEAAIGEVDEPPCLTGKSAAAA
jgi:hypothetical protein